jgi:hypothetical protein
MQTSSTRTSRCSGPGGARGAPLIRPAPVQPAKPSRLRAVLAASLCVLSLGLGSGASPEVPYQLISDFESGELAPWQPSVSPSG